jgi:hypothetical protein
MSTTVPMMSGAQAGSMSKRISCHEGLSRPSRSTCGAPPHISGISWRIDLAVAGDRSGRCCRRYDKGLRRMADWLAKCPPLGHIRSHGAVAERLKAAVC